MNKQFFIIMVSLAALSSPSLAQTVSQTIEPGGTVTTITETPGGDNGMTTQILTTTPLSKKTKLIDGTPLELDSDGMVYVVYPDGARAYAPDGVQTLIDGTTITVKDGRRVP